MRLFTAIELPAELKHRLARTGREIVERRWGYHAGETPVTYTRELNLHVTLKFLGDVNEQDVPKICGALREVRTNGGPLALRIGGLELFPPRGPVRIVAAAVTGEVERLVLLHADIERACAAVGIPRETRSYKPHITLARAKFGLAAHCRPQSADAARALFDNGSWSAEEFVLMSSELKPTGPMYARVAQFSLHDDAGES